MDNPYTIKNVNVVDVAKGAVLARRAVVINGERIEAVDDAGTDVPPPASDGAGLYLCPGLIDCHVHFFLDGGESPGRTFVESDDEGKMQVARRNARVAIEAGITTMRDCGAPAAAMLQFRQELADEHAVGPHIVCCGHPLMRPRGHCHFLGGAVSTENDVTRLIEGQLKKGANFVKLIASGGGLTPGTKPHEAELDLSLMKTAVEVAHANGVHVTAHCHATESMNRAVEAGLDMIEHASFVEQVGYRYDEQLAVRMRDRGIVVSPTVFGALRTAKHFRETGQLDNPEDFAAVERLEGRLINTRHFHRLGVSLIGGSDCGGSNHTPFDSMVEEMLAYTRADLSNVEVLRAVTSDSARFMRLTGVGEVKRGYRADLVLIRSNPLEDLNALRDPVKVFKAGRLVHERPEPDHRRRKTA